MEIICVTSLSKKATTVVTEGVTLGRIKRVTFVVSLLQKVTSYSNALLPSTDNDDVTHTSSCRPASGLVRKQQTLRVIG